MNAPTFVKFKCDIWGDFQTLCIVFTPKKLFWVEVAGRCASDWKRVLKMKQFYRMINASRRVLILIIRDLNDFFAIIIIDTSFGSASCKPRVENQKNRRIIIIRPSGNHFLFDINHEPC